jgi:hypothetical protein
MKNNDLSNKMLPRIVVVFEGKLGVLPKENEKACAKAFNKKHYDEALGYYELDELMMRKLLDLRYRQDINVSIVTWLGDDMAVAISELMDEEGIPIGECFASTPSRLARELAYNPDIVTVYDPDDDHRFTYGSKGVVLVDANQLGRF